MARLLSHASLSNRCCHPKLSTFLKKVGVIPLHRERQEGIQLSSYLPCVSPDCIVVLVVKKSPSNKESISNPRKGGRSRCVFLKVPELREFHVELVSDFLGAAGCDVGSCARVAAEEDLLREASTASLEPFDSNFGGTALLGQFVLILEDDHCALVLVFL